MAVVITCKSGDDLEYVWVNQPENKAAQAPAEGRGSGYYIDAAEHGEAPGRWWGPGAESLGLATGSRVARDAYMAVYRQIDPRTGESMGRSPGNYDRFNDLYLAKLTAEPQATEARKNELLAEAHKESRIAYPYTDVTVSFSKDISLLGAAIRENLRQDQVADDGAGQLYWQGRLDAFQECLQAGNRAALEYAQRWAGVTRTGYHGTRVDGKEPGKIEEAGLIVSSWLQGTSRAGDPQEHVHNQFARLVRTFSDGKMRTKDTNALKATLPGMAGVAAVHAEAALAQEFGVGWHARADGRGYEIDGVPTWLKDLFSSRTVSIEDRMPEAISEWTRRHDGAQPSKAQVYVIRQQVTMASRATKTDGDIDWNAHAQEWDARSNGALAQLPAQVSSMRGPGGAGANTRNTRNPGAPPTLSAIAEASRDALMAVQAQRSAWTRADLLKVLSVTMPAESRQMTPDAAVRLLERMADDVLASKHGDVVSLEAPEFLTWPESMRRGPDRRVVYERPGATRYATQPHLDAEHSLVSHAQRLGGWSMDPARAAGLLGATQEDLEHALVARTVDAGQARTTTGLRLDQAAALYHALTNARTATVLTGPAGSGKSHSLGAAARAAVEAGAAEVYGVACSQTATNVLRDAGVAAGVPVTAANSSAFLGLRRPGDDRPPRPMRVAPGSVILIDEASMLPLDHLLAIMRTATANGCKVIVAGDQEQLSAVEGGGAMKLLSQRLGYARLAEPVRFDHQWERDASLRLRDGDDTVLETYDQQGRLRPGTADVIMDQAARAYVANTLQGIHTRLIAMDWERCRELSRRVRDDLKHLGVVSDGPTITLADGVQASAGDLIVCRDIDHPAGLANGDVLRVESVGDGRAELRMVVGRDASGGAAFAESTVTYGKFSKMNLAYAMTGHSAMGDTVTAGIAVVTGREARNWLYVALSRGADTNLAYVIDETDKAELSPAPAPAPELARFKRIKQERAGYPAVRQKLADSDRHYIAVLADVMSRDGTQDSATEIQRRSLANADHLGILHQIWQTETLEARTGNYKEMMTQLLPPHLQNAGESHQAQWLFRTFRQGELCGQDPLRLMAKAVAAGSLDDARDVASVLNHRIQGYIAGMVPKSVKWSDQVPAVADPELAQFIAELADAMDGRKDRLGEFAAEAQPGWITDALGPVPDDPMARLEWQHKAASVGAYREIYNFARDDEAIGPEPSVASPEKHAAWMEADTAMGSPGTADLTGHSDAQLRARRSAYERETAWAPAYAHNELAQVRIGLFEAAQGRIRSEAEAAVAREAGNEEAAARHERIAGSHQVLADRYRDAQPDLVASVEDYDNWLAVTEMTRRVGTAADAELRRRYPDDKLPALVSAEPGRVTEAEHDELAALPDDLAEPYERPAWLAELAESSRRYRAQRAERESQQVPAEDHGREPEGFAWRPSLARHRDAVLQPAPPEIRPAEAVAVAQEANHEAEASR